MKFLVKPLRAKYGTFYLKVPSYVPACTLEVQRSGAKKLVACGESWVVWSVQGWAPETLLRDSPCNSPALKLALWFVKSGEGHSLIFFFFFFFFKLFWTNVLRLFTITGVLLLNRPAVIRNPWGWVEERLWVWCRVNGLSRTSTLPAEGWKQSSAWIFIQV